MKYILLITLVLSSVSGVLLNSNFFRRKSFFYYFTNISNTMVAIYYLLELLPDNPIGNKYLQYTVTMSILVTFIIYHFIISKGTRKRNDPEEMKDYRSIENRLVHYITPALATAYYLLYNEETFDIFYSVVWLIYPVVYTLITLLRASLGKKIPDRNSKYPYDFIDIDKIGVSKFIRNSILILLFFITLGIAFLYLKHLIF